MEGNNPICQNAKGEYADTFDNTTAENNRVMSDELSEQLRTMPNTSKALQIHVTVEKRS